MALPVFHVDRRRTRTYDVRRDNAAEMFEAIGEALDSAVIDTFETVSKNLDASGAVLAYSSGNLASITYANGVVKTLNYTGDTLTSVVLSGATPAGIDLTKTLTYTGDDLTGVTYS